MKKLKFLIVFALILVIGGVYATWTYAGTDTTPGSETISLTLAGKDTSDAKGTITVDTSGLTITIDQKDDTYAAKIIVEGKITATFTPATTDASTANGILMEFKLTDNTGSWGLTEGDKADIFTVTTEAQTINSTAALTVEISADTIAALITPTFALPTAAHYDSFKTYIEGITNPFVIEVSEVEA